MSLVSTSAPAIGEVSLRVTSGSSAVEFTRFLSYEYADDYLSPSDSWNFQLAEKELAPADAAVLVPGASVQLVVGGHVQSNGFIDDVASDLDASGGTVVHVEGRDWLSVAVDSQVDPQQTFQETQSLLDVVTQVFAPYGVKVVATDAIANRNVITGRIYGEKVSKKGRELKSVKIYRERPHPNEGAFAFVSRVSQRFGLWVRPAVDGKTVIVGQPDFDQAPRYGLQHVYGAGSISNNVVRGHFKRSRMEQPSVIYASGFGGGGNFPKSILRAGVVNPVVDADNSRIINAYPTIKFAELPPVTAAFPPIVEGMARPAFLYDPESHTQEQLEAFLRRELSLRMRKALQARYEIMGHSLNGQPIAVDTIINLNDARPTVKWQGYLWILGRRFSKSASAGTRTTIEGILPGSLVF